MMNKVENKKKANEDNLITMLKSGDNQAFEFLIKKYFALLVIFSEKVTKERQSSEDIVEDVFVKLWERHKTFSTYDEIKGYLYLVTNNLSLNLLRNRQREFLRNNEFLKISYQDEPDLATEIIFSERLAEINNAIEELPEKMREIFKLSYYDRYSNQDIAFKLKLSHQTVRNQKYKAINILKSKLNGFILILFLRKSSILMIF